MSSQVAGLRRFAAARKSGSWVDVGDRTIVVGGVRGGAGASTVAALLALACAGESRRTLLIDTDDVVGTQHRILGVSGTNGFASLQDAAIATENTLLQITDHCALLPGGIGGDTNHLPLGTSERRAVFRRIGQLYNEFDVVIIDAGARLDGIIAAAGRGAWRFIGVAGVDPVSLASSYALVKAVETRWPGAPHEVLINKHDDARARTAFEQVRTATQHFLSRGVGFAGAIPLDQTVADAFAAAQPLRAAADHSTAASRAARTIAARLMAELDDAPSPEPRDA